MSEIGTRIKDKRKSIGLSQNKLAQQVGITQPFMAEIESGRKQPSLNILEKICEVLGFNFINEKGESKLNQESDKLKEISTNGIYHISKDRDDLLQKYPPEAIKEIESFIDYIDHKYGLTEGK